MRIYNSCPEKIFGEKKKKKKIKTETKQKSKKEGKCLVVSLQGQLRRLCDKHTDPSDICPHRAHFLYFFSYIFLTYYSPYDYTMHKNRDIDYPKVNPGFCASLDYTFRFLFLPNKKYPPNITVTIIIAAISLPFPLGVFTCLVNAFIRKFILPTRLISSQLIPSMLI